MCSSAGLALSTRGAEENCRNGRLAGVSAANYVAKASGYGESEDVKWQKVPTPREGCRALPPAREGSILTIPGLRARTPAARAANTSGGR